MKILVCVYEYYPKGSGIANVAYYVVENLRKRGHECTVLSSNSGDIALNYDKKIKRYAGIGLLLFWRKTREYIIKNYDNYDLIWIHNPLFLGKINPKKVYATVHTSYVKYWDLYKNNKDYSRALKTYYFFMRKLEERCYRQNKFKSNVISPAVVEELTTLGISKKNITYIPNGVDTKVFCPAKSRKENKIKKLICVGRVSYQKNPYGLIRAIQELNKDKQKVEFSWIGDGELLEALRKYVIDNKIKGAKFIGKIQHDKIRSIYQQGDVYILASIYEGQPLTMLEAMSTGLPCIVSDIENMAHIIRESKCGKVVNFDDPKKAAKEIDAYINSKKLELDKKKVREYSVKNLDWSRITDRYEEEWKKIVKK
jgi:glycosyltransferase involved in cell wall biosynthesis